MTFEILQRTGLNWRFGYKIISAEAGPDAPRCFFRFLDGKWHDVRAKNDFGYRASQVLEILKHEMAAGHVLMIFACCCGACQGNPLNADALQRLLTSGVKSGDVSHGYWPQHEPKAKIPVVEFRRQIELAQNDTEVRRIILECLERLMGPEDEVNAALDFALQREMHFAGGAEGTKVKAEGQRPKAKVPTLALAGMILILGMQDRLEAGSSVGLISQSTRVQIPAPATTSTFSLQPSTLFYALGQLETGNNDQAHGRAGEVSRFQILASEWRRTTALPLSAAANPVTAWNVVRGIMDERVDRFESRWHRAPTVREWYVLYSRPAVFLGDGGRHLSRAEQERAERFENLANRQDAKTSKLIQNSIIIGCNIIVTNDYEFAFGGFAGVPIYKTRMTPDEAKTLFNLISRSKK